MIGRETERTELRDLIARTRHSGHALVLAGDPGIGKTVLLDHAVGEAQRAGFRVLRCAGLQNAAPVGFEALHELLHPLLPLADALPTRQRSALMVAFALEDGPAPDRLVVGLACLGLLEEAASTNPILVAVEDAQWLDTSSRSVLEFVARRLSQAPILLIATTRPEGDNPFAGSAQRLTVGPLNEPACSALLDHLAHDLPPGARSRILEEAGGNPLALRELPMALRELGSDHLALGSRLPTTKRLEHAFLDQLAEIPAPSRRLLILAAAADGAELHDIMAAARTMDAGVEDLEPLESTGLISTTAAGLRFRHPLVRSAVEGAATTAEWTSAHLALASVVPDRARAAWHRASATLERDEAVATELDTMAQGARQRGAQPEAMRAYRRAAALSPGPVEYARRLAAAAEAARTTGMNQEAAELLEQAESVATEPDTIADIAATRLSFSMQVGVPGHSGAELVATSRALSRRPEDVDRRVKILWGAAINARGRNLPQAEWRRLRAEIDSLTTSSPLKSIALALLAPLGEAAELRARLPELIPALGNHAQGLLTLAIAAESLQDPATALTCWDLCVERCHDQGQVADQAQALRGRANILLLLGRVTEGLADAEYAVRMARDTGQPLTQGTAHATVARAHALLGDVDKAREALRAYHELDRLGPLALASADAHWAAGLIAMIEHRPQEAVIEFTHMAVHPTRSMWAIADHTEAAVRANRLDSVPETIRTTEDTAHILGSAYLTALVARSRALVADSPEGEFERALNAGATGGSPLELARTHLLYGEWLRRRRRVVDARAHLADALRRFDAIGARTFGERAASELRAAGETPPRPASEGPGPRKSLTPQELQVAQLAAQGLSNKEIADRVYLSHRTVSTHLYRVYPKLGIAGRWQLAAALGVTAH
ncbi:AAA family ATPase [Actinoplanes sp. NPDC049596]|uniref:helix-turn-helix transcriptional regulator n=1 Tax=unclassified Actinoplanes TaxID=2626549 RepID=UPI00341DB291